MSGRLAGRGLGAARAAVAASAQAAWAALALGGCASQIPQAIRTEPAQPTTVAQVQQAPAALAGRQVRWGGRIVATINLPDSTEIEVLSRALNTDGRPRTGAPGQGRFIARATGFLDPAEYAEDRELTVTGPILGVETRKVGEYPYAYPVVAAQTRYLWPKSLPPPVYPGPWPGWPYGPGFGPWWGPGWGPGWGPWWGPW